MNVIYVDELFFLNALTDYLLLLSCARLRGRALRRTRFAAAAGLGGVYAVFAAIPPLSFLVSLAVKALVSLLMAWIAFGAPPELWRGWGCFLALSSAFAGAVCGISLLSGAEVYGSLSGASLKTLALSFGLCYAAVRLFFGRFLKRRERCVVEAKIELCGKPFPCGRCGTPATRFSTRSPARASCSRSRALSLRSLLPHSFCRCRTIRRHAFASCPHTRCSRGGCGSSAFPPSARSGGCSCAFVPTPSRSRASQSNISSPSRRRRSAAGSIPRSFEYHKEVMPMFSDLLQQLLLALLPNEPVYYIGGSEVLPPPLSREEETAALTALCAGDKSAERTLIEHNLRLVVYIARRFENTGVGLEDLISIGTIGLIKAVSTFDREKNIKLATYASRCIENEILMYLRKLAAQRTEVSFDEPLNTDWDGNELLLSDVLGTDEDEVSRPMEDDADRRALHEAVARLSERDRDIISLRFGLLGRREYTQKEVAARMGISQSYISRLEKRILLRLRREMQKIMA